MTPLMDLPNLFSTKKQSPRLYLTIVLSDSTVQTSLWELSQSTARQLHHSAVKSYSDIDDVVVKTDQALQELGKESERVDEVIMGLEPAWVTQANEPVDGKKPILQKITEELHLKALGFVVVSEALATWLVRQEPRLSTLMVYVTKISVSTLLIQHGAIGTAVSVGRSGDAVADLTESIARLAADQQVGQLPARIIIAGMEMTADELAAIQQQIMQHEWIGINAFVHPPTVDLIKDTELLDAIIFESGQSVSKEPVTLSGSSTVLSPTGAPHQPTISAKSFGIPIPVVEPTAAPTKIQDEELAVMTPTQVLQPIIHSKNSDDDYKPTSSTQKPFRTNSWPNRILSWFGHHKTFAIAGFAAGLLTLFIITFIWLSTTTQALVVIDVAAKPVAKDVTITLDIDQNEPDPVNLLLPAVAVTEEVVGKKTNETTGVKLVGDKAGGTVTLFNKTDSTKTLDAGTQLSSGKFIFTLNETVQIASASVERSTSSENREYGKADVRIIATAIGADYNLPEKTEFTVASFSTDTYSAIATGNFTGGTSREVRVVSQKDQDELLTSLKKELIDQGNESLQNKTTEGLYLVPTNQIEVVASEYDAEVGDEVSVLTLDLTVHVSALTYDGEDLRPIADQILADDIPEGFVLAAADPQILSAPAQTASASSKVTLSANIASQAVPNINLDELKGRISGQSLTESEQHIKSLPHIEGVTISLNPSLAEKLRPRLPKDPAKIELQLKKD